MWAVEGLGLCPSSPQNKIGRYRGGSEIQISPYPNSRERKVSNPPFTDPKIPLAQLVNHECLIPTSFNILYEINIMWLFYIYFV